MNDNSVVVNQEQCRAFGKHLKTIEFHPESLNDPLLFPSPRLPSSTRATFYFYMVAIDHQTHPPGELFEARIGSRHLHGADLLYALALKRLTTDEGFFNPRNILNLTLREFKEMFTVRTPRNTVVTVHEPKARLQLWRDMAEQLLARDVEDILGYLEQVRIRNHEELLSVRSIQRALRPFQAYSDPVMKKSCLLLKFLLRAHLVTIKDPESLSLPIDNHLIRLALRIGLVKIDESRLRQKILAHEPFTEHEDTILRDAVKRAYDLVLKVVDKPAVILDDLFWHVGRTICVKDAPNCVMMRKDPIIELKERIKLKTDLYCPFVRICPASRDANYRQLIEPNYRSIYY